MLKPLQDSRRQNVERCYAWLSGRSCSIWRGMRKAALAVEFLIRHMYVVALDQKCCSSLAAALWVGLLLQMVSSALARTRMKRYVPRSCSERRGVKWERGGRSRAVVRNWGSGCMWLPWELWASPGEVLPGGEAKGPWSREREEEGSVCWGCSKRVAGGWAVLIPPGFVTLWRGAVEISVKPQIQHYLLIHGRRSDEQEAEVTFKNNLISSTCYKKKIERLDRQSEFMESRFGEGVNSVFWCFLNSEPVCRLAVCGTHVLCLQPERGNTLWIWENEKVKLIINRNSFRHHVQGASSELHRRSRHWIFAGLCVISWICFHVPSHLAYRSKQTEKIISKLFY